MRQSKRSWRADQRFKAQEKGGEMMFEEALHLLGNYG